MKAALALVSALAAVAFAAPSPDIEAAEAERVLRGVKVARDDNVCEDCIKRCQEIGGIGDAACKVVICAIQVRVSSLNSQQNFECCVPLPPQSNANNESSLSTVRCDRCRISHRHENIIDVGASNDRALDQVGGLEFGGLLDSGNDDREVHCQARPELTTLSFTTNFAF